MLDLFANAAPQVAVAAEAPVPDAAAAAETETRRKPKGAAAPEAGPNGKPPPPPRASAESMAGKQREISVSEFFTKNRHLLGFDNPVKALLTAIKEAVDNSLDACEEAGIMPEITVEIHQLAEDRFQIAIEDNGPGIVPKQLPRIFGKLLYGSKFHTMKQSRGQQGIGISAAGMYGQLTTGKPMQITSRPGARAKAHHVQLMMDLVKNEPRVLVDEELPDWYKPHGTRIVLELEATYRKGKQSVDAYIEQTALANPHAAIRYHPPKEEPLYFPRAVDELPPDPKEIKPHPHGVELGILMKMLQDTKAKTIEEFLCADFSRVSPRVAAEILEKAKLSPKSNPGRVGREHAEALHKAIGATKILAPPTNCISPIGAGALEASLRKQVKADFYTAVSRPPQVYRGNPFVVEAALAYGGDMPADELADVSRLANRVPLLYQAGACAVNKAVVQTAWRNYGIGQSKGALPTGPLKIVVHMASVWVPFTSESKEAIAHYPEIMKEIRLALQECGRKLNSFIRRERRMADEMKKRNYIEMYIPHIGDALRDMLKLSDDQRQRAIDILADTLERTRKI